MIKLTSCDIDGGNEKVIWINVSHIISIEPDAGRTLVWLVDGVRVYVTESVDEIIKEMGYGES